MNNPTLLARKMVVQEFIDGATAAGLVATADWDGVEVDDCVIVEVSDSELAPVREQLHFEIDLINSTFCITVGSSRYNIGGEYRILDADNVEKYLNALWKVMFRWEQKP